MDDAGKRFDERGLSRIEHGANRYGIDRRNGDELCQATGQTRDAVLAVELALMRISRATVFAECLTSQTHAIQTLIHHDVIANSQVMHFASNFFNATANLMAQNLRLNDERDLLAALVH